MKYAIILYPVAICATVIFAVYATQNVWCLLALAFLPNIRWSDDAGEGK